MSFAEAVGASALRALPVALLAVLFATGLVRRVAGNWRSTPALYALAFVPLLPVLYVYVQKLAPPRGAWSAECAVVLLEALALAPWVGILGAALPAAPLDAEGRFLGRLAQHSGARRFEPIAHLRHGDGRRLVLGFGLAFALAFQEFEAPSLLSRPAFPVWLFDAIGTGEPVFRAGLLAAPVAVFTAAVIVGSLALLPRALAPRRDRDCAEAKASRRSRWTFTAVALGIVVVVPALVLGASVTRASLVELRPFTDQWASTVAFAASAALAAAGIARLLQDRSLLVQCLVLLPGCAGPLLVALATRSLFLSMPLRPLYDTPLPLLLAWVVWLLPIAWLLERALRERRDDPAVFLAALLRDADSGARTTARRVLAETVGRPRTAIVLLLFAVAAFEVQAGALLAPTRFPPAAVRLYNLMHYGRSDSLSLLLGSTVAVLLGVAALAFLVPSALLAWSGRSRA